MLQFITLLEKIPRAAGAGLVIALVLAIAAIYFHTSASLAISIFFFLPIAIAVCSLGRVAGIATAILSAFVATIVDIESGMIQRSPDYTVVNEILRLLLYTLIAIMLAALKDSADHHKAAARVDDLTGIYNRRAFQEFAELEIARSRRTGRPITIAFTDIDNFKNVNDSDGHQAGDRVLSQTADLMRSSVRAVDRVARFGGDEFVILLSETDATAAASVMERLRQDLTRMAELNGWPISYSIGAYTFKRPPESVDEMVSRADRLMYTVKQSGKDRCLHDTE